jgi:hypothetical protein
MFRIVQNNLWDWQSLQVTSGPGELFFQFCDALEVKDGQSATATGWGLDHALAAWSSYFKNTYLGRSKLYGSASSYCNLILVVVCSGQTAELVIFWSTAPYLIDLIDLIRACLGTYNTSQSYWTDTHIDNAGRSWNWIV